MAAVPWRPLWWELRSSRDKLRPPQRELWRDRAVVWAKSCWWSRGGVSTEPQMVLCNWQWKPTQRHVSYNGARPSRVKNHPQHYWTGLKLSATPCSQTTKDPVKTLQTSVCSLSSQVLPCCWCMWQWKWASFALLRMENIRWKEWKIFKRPPCLWNF